MQIMKQARQDRLQVLEPSEHGLCLDGTKQRLMISSADNTEKRKEDGNAGQQQEQMKSCATV